jgi:hypothetical protein
MPAAQAGVEVSVRPRLTFLHGAGTATGSWEVSSWQRGNYDKADSSLHNNRSMTPNHRVRHGTTSCCKSTSMPILRRSGSCNHYYECLVACKLSARALRSPMLGAHELLLHKPFASFCSASYRSRGSMPMSRIATYHYDPCPASHPAGVKAV